ncbi:MAG: Cobalamin biosynthesis protein CbiB [Pseudomonadota bacterium]
MSFFSIFLALVIEQARPLGSSHFLHQWLRRWADWVASHVDGGTRSQAWLAWGLLIGAPACVGLLYVTLGFRQFSHHFTGIRDALNDGDEPLARQLLANWQQIEINDLPRNEIVRHVIEHSVLSAHRHVFGVFFSYALLSIVGLGPVGAVVYRIAEFAKRYWSQAPSVSAATGTIPTQQDNANWHSDSLRRVATESWHAPNLGTLLIGSLPEQRPWASPSWAVSKMRWTAGDTMPKSFQMTTMALSWPLQQVLSMFNWGVRHFSPIYQAAAVPLADHQNWRTLPKSWASYGAQWSCGLCWLLCFPWPIFWAKRHFKLLANGWPMTSVAVLAPQTAAHKFCAALDSLLWLANQ